MRERIDDLINGGDWACSWAYPGGLAAVCDELATVLDLSLARRARHVASMARVDMRSASREWSALVDELRDRPRTDQWPEGPHEGGDRDHDQHRPRRGPEPSRVIL